MGQKVNPHGLRVGVIKNWDSRWFAEGKKISEYIMSDYKIREYLKKALFDGGIPKIEIERDANRVRIFIHCSKPGVVIGRGGENIEKLRRELEKMAGRPVAVNVIEVKTPDMSAQLVAESICGQLERRTAPRRAMKQSLLRTMRAGAKGVKILVSGRLNGAEIASDAEYKEGTVPLQMLRADIDYGFWEAQTTYGKLGVKVWIFKGEVLADVKRNFTIAAPAHTQSPTGERRDDRRGGRDGDRRGGGDRGGRGGDRGGRGGNDRGGQGRSGGYGGGQGGSRPYGDRPQGSSQGGSRPYGDRPQGSSQGGSRPYGDRPQGGQGGPRFGGQQQGGQGRSGGYGGGQGGSRPYGDRPARPTSDRPARPIRPTEVRPTPTDGAPKIEVPKTEGGNE